MGRSSLEKKSLHESCAELYTLKSECLEKVHVGFLIIVNVFDMCTKFCSLEQSVKAPDGSRLKFTTRQQTMQKQTWKTFEATQFYQGPR